MKEISGKLFGKLTAVRDTGTRSDKYNCANWECACECGGKKIVPRKLLLRGQVRSCGCLWQGFPVKHGHTTRAGGDSPEYTSYKGMLRRCHNKSYIHYDRYGGRGIKVCDRWLGDGGFVNFLADMGSRPSPKHTLDRINNNGDYCPANCRWATRLEQARNRSCTVFLEGVPLSAVSEKHGIDHSVVLNRRNLGWPDERLFIPLTK